MNIVGIIAEYNPMHNGHVYQIEQAKKRAKADYAIILMSGSFTEQGNIAICNKFSRAATAISCGADMVIELPTIHAISSSENFAYNAVTILNNLNIVTHLSFGSECKDIDVLNSIAKKEIESRAYIIQKTKEYMKQGLSSIASKDKAMQELLSKNEYQEIAKSNNMLAVQYLCALKRLDSKIKPVLIPREEVSHSDSIIRLEGNFASSTAIRNMLQDTKILVSEKENILKNIIPYESLNMLISTKLSFNENIWNNLKYSIITKGPVGLKNIYEISEGLENRIYEMGLNSNSYHEFISKVKCKRYTLSRIKRICVYILLNVTNDLENKLSHTSYARVLKLKAGKEDLLSHISKKSSIPVITKVTNENINSFTSNISESIKLDILATNLTTTNTNSDYTNNIIV